VQRHGNGESAHHKEQLNAQGTMIRDPLNGTRKLRGDEKLGDVDQHYRENSPAAECVHVSILCGLGCRPCPGSKPTTIASLRIISTFLNAYHGLSRLHSPPNRPSDRRISVLLDQHSPLAGSDHPANCNRLSEAASTGAEKAVRVGRFRAEVGATL
jgi:hypothetical protein